ncbi:TVP38/TMEM64 family protein [Streptococcus macacae]|uniref:TVP38/TMEM64 family membrane protein n=1 Tax=Streptococcus macacae NCTC 11558 TaxID=764298 RepID=G5JUG8_9STRE|nr:TVP38/TMEM64 family protein [Streptococcus macacae]EHJ52346.1 SNARE-like domain protein [Streptococcus macacae NCTC 11558]SUN78610.1 membrane protein [Streptococcus macacae NCTC 11558]
MKEKLSKHFVMTQKIIQFLGILAIIGSVVLVIWFYKLGILNDSNALKDLVQRHKVIGPLIFILVQIFQIVFPVIPGGVTTVAGFLIFGTWTGFILNYIGILIGSVILFLLVKWFGRKFILLFMKEETFYKYEAKLESDTYEKLFIFSMLSPVSPADIMVMITGLTSMSLKRFTTILIITKPLSIIAYSYFWIYGSKIVEFFFK